MGTILTQQLGVTDIVSGTAATVGPLVGLALAFGVGVKVARMAIGAATGVIRK